ncbi:MAG: recombination protein NinB [Patescibacteria group bacterium]|nr:recombination protein NinB [Patescibacteria group bacterium]
MIDYQTNTIILATEQHRQGAIKRIENAPLGIQVKLSMPEKVRTKDQNARYWGKGILATIASQGWWNGRQHSAPSWHEFFKFHFLPDVAEPKITKADYVKFSESIETGELILTGSTTDLLTLGMCNYCDEVEAWAVQELGIQFPYFSR